MELLLFLFYIFLFYLLKAKLDIIITLQNQCLQGLALDQMARISGFYGHWDQVHVIKGPFIMHIPCAWCEDTEYLHISIPRFLTYKMKGVDQIVSQTLFIFEHFQIYRRVAKIAESSHLPFTPLPQCQHLINAQYTNQNEELTLV